MLTSLATRAAESPEPKYARVRAARTFFYRPVRDVALDVIAAYPPDQFHYVGVGRGPTPFMAMLQAILGDQAATNLPLSYLRNLQPPERRAADAEPKRERTHVTKVMARFHAHLRHFLPGPRDAEGQKTLLFIDYADSGVSLINLKRELDAYNGSVPASLQRRYAYLGLTHGRNGITERLTAQGIATITLTGRALYLSDQHLFKHLAEYSFWSVTSSDVHKPEPNTREVKRAVLRRDTNPQLNRSQRHNRDLRDLRRRAIEEYQNAEDYYDLRLAYAARVRHDPAIPASGAKPAGPVMRWCQARLGRAVDAVYGARVRK